MRTIGASTACRTTTSWGTIAAGHSRVDQMSSLPEVMLTVRVSGDTVQVHAAVTRVRRLRVIGTSLPPGASVMVGVATTSAFSQVPTGSASGGSVGVGLFLRRFGVSVGTAGASVASVSPGVAVVLVVAPAVVACGSASDEASLDEPSSRARPATSSTATPSTTRRRNQ